MITKYTIARKIASQGIDVFIANGTRDSIITDIVRGKDVPYTHFVASNKKETGVKKWLSHSDTFAKGAVVINDGAREALFGEKATSLLMIGITKVEGFFKRGDIVRIIDEEGNNIGLGKSQYDSKKAEQNIGEKLSKPFIHYDYLVINEKNKKVILSILKTSCRKSITFNEWIALIYLKNAIKAGRTLNILEADTINKVLLMVAEATIMQFRFYYCRE